MKIEIGNELRLDDVPPWLREKLVQRFTLTNPQWLDRKRLGRWHAGTPQTLKFYGTFRQSLFLPRGYTRRLLSQCRNRGIPCELTDRRRVLPEADFTFQGKLRPFQERAVRDMAAREFGTLAAPTGSGKTVMGLALIARRRQPALVVVHTRELLEQWLARIEEFLGIPRDEIGRIGGGKQSFGHKVTVALVQSLYKCTDQTAERVGHLVVDECHRTPSRTFTEAVRSFDCRYMLGLSATPWRRDRLTPLIFWHLGDVTHEVPREVLLATGDVLPAEVVIRQTSFEPLADPVTEYPRMLQELTEDDERNTLIARDIATEAARDSGVCLVLSDRKSHCETIRTLLDDLGVPAERLTGDLAEEDRRRVVEMLNQGRVRVVVATGQLVGEGFDCRHLTTLFLTTPVRFDGRLLQYLGRVLRPAPGKDRARIYDYVDENVGVLRAAARTRRRVYTGT